MANGSLLLDELIDAVVLLISFPTADASPPLDKKPVESPMVVVLDGSTASGSSTLDDETLDEPLAPDPLVAESLALDAAAVDDALLLDEDVPPEPPVMAGNSVETVGTLDEALPRH